MSTIGRLGNRIQVPPELVANAAGAIDLGSANKAIFIPFRIDEPVKVASMEIAVDTTGGNCDIGIYTQAGKRLASAGSTAVAAAGIQNFNITDLLLSRGAYYAAFVLSGTTAKIWGGALTGTNAINMTAYGMGQMAAALPLPATATIVAMTSGSYPNLYLIPSGAW